ncbi:xyloglucan endotransglucosylase/hydrolase protein 2-like [Phalaenopsis equestris]|uniref:xyloglucan endotransglucosylase/hydrolase protein 2-like n=1 Tax=Phalaenopsis equestris TaxID=78828 RepID=UPI0009E4187D|nr:xyloglucan endotransglucosylase/hydrolase protein 2-like [Phalaenopsis equestris]
MITAEIMASAPLLLLLLVACMGWATTEGAKGFHENYAESWGGDRIKVLNGESEVLLSMDQTTGSGFGSKLKYGSGYFHMRIKLPAKNSSGVVTAFYLASGSDKHAELDFEFLGNLEGQPIILQTNVFANGKGNREQRVKLRFNPTADFHDYKILWNSHQIVFYVDETPIRVFANKQTKGVDYPSQPMQIIASVWNGDSWATDGGKAKVDWSSAPFNAYFQGFDVDGCVSTSSNDPRCSSSSLWWNSATYQQLSSSERSAYQKVKKEYVIYDYCNDVKRFPSPPPECPQ